MTPGSSMADPAGSGTFKCVKGADGKITKSLEKATKCTFNGKTYTQGQRFTSSDGKTEFVCYKDGQGRFRVKADCKSQLSIARLAVEVEAMI